MDMLRRLCKDGMEVLDLIDQAVQRSDGRPPETVDNINSLDSRPTGTSEQAAIRWLRKDRPDLLEKVVAGEMTAHGAMVEAGFSACSRPADRPPNGRDSGDQRAREGRNPRTNGIVGAGGEQEAYQS
jgi:hypothetical protein